MVDLKQLANTLVNLTVKEVNELATVLKNDYGIEPTPMTTMGVSLGESTENSITNNEEKTEFDLILRSCGTNKLAVVKLVKDLTGKGLKESKDLVDNAPQSLKNSISKDEANTIKKQLEEIGAEVVIQ